MKKIIYFNALQFIVALLFVVSCSQETLIPNKESYRKLYIPQAVHGLVQLEIPHDSAEPDTIFFGAAIGGFAVNDKELEVGFSIDESAVEIYNDAHNTAYVLLPQANYELVASHTQIARQQVNSSLSELIIVPDGLEEEKPYLLPITVSAGNENVLLNDELRTLYVAVILEKAPPVFRENLDRTGWKIHEYSSHDPWEGGAEGHVNSLLDDHFYTFWITQWMDRELPLPHAVAIDMNETTEFHGISFMNRTFWGDYGNGQPSEVNIEVSDNGTDWVSVKSFQGIEPPATGVEPAGTWLRLPFEEPVHARYFKFIVVGIHGSGSSTSVAELSAF